MRLVSRPIRVGVIAVTGLAVTALTGAFGASAAASPRPGVPALVPINGSLPATTDTMHGAYTSARMSVEVALQPRDQAQLASQLQAIYTPGSGQYGKFLPKGAFDARYDPSGAQRNAVVSYLRASGLTVVASGSPFLVRAVGPSQTVQATFHTRLSNYVDARGVHYFSNSTAVRLPASLAHSVIGVIGLANTVRIRPAAVRQAGPMKPLGTATVSGKGCETGYPTAADLFNAVNNGVQFPYGYGAGPGCSGLTPSQVNSIYGAPRLGSRGKGAGVNAAVFELSGYQRSDITTWARTFYGKRYHAPLVDINTDGGPLNPACPVGDTCVGGYSGDIEVVADIEMSLAIAPDVKHLLVYNAPNDYTGQTELDEYSRIANQDVASTISSSWGLCENDAGVAYAQAENVIFEKMAMQGQSMFNAAGDTGAFGCIRGSGIPIVNAGDPASQPWVTSVGGTSLESDNPGTNRTPAYRAGVETVWNVDNLCSNLGPGPTNGQQLGSFWCGATGAGGGGPSEFWGMPSYQRGRGVTSVYTTYGNGSTQCILATAGTACRETPDISANADEYTGYAEYCTGGASTPGSVCATLTGEPVAGWFMIGGTSLSTPLWAAITADRDGYLHRRAGNLNPLLYKLFNTKASRYFHDITGIGPLQQAATSNGQFPTTPGYDMATGIGTPKMAALITGK